MALPKVDLPTYELKIPSSGKEITVRPFLVKEEKLLLIAAESDDENEIINTTKQVINNCILTEGINVETLPFFDIDYLFIALRAKSIGESVDMKFTCNNVVEDNRCGHIFNAEIDISKAEVKQDVEISKDIKLSNKTSIRMKYPSYTTIKMISEKDNNMERKIKVMMNCIEYILDGEAVHSSKDYTKEELREFIEGLTENQFNKLETFVENFPYFVVNLDATCGKCKFEHHIEYKDFASFFQ